METRTAVITGCSGYLGSHLAKYLKRDGWKVIGFDIKEPTHNYYDNFFIGDIRFRYDLNRLFVFVEKIDVVFHLAGRIEVGDSMMNPTEFWEVNVAGHYYGRYPSEKLAAIIYNQKATLLFGEFAKLNPLD